MKRWQESNDVKTYPRRPGCRGRGRSPLLGLSQNLDRTDDWPYMEDLSDPESRIPSERNGILCSGYCCFASVLVSAGTFPVIPGLHRCCVEVLVPVEGNPLPSTPAVAYCLSLRVIWKP